MIAALLLTAVLAGVVVWAMRREGKRLATRRRFVSVTFSVDTAEFERAMRRAARAVERLRIALERMEDRA